jgi:hypothetical protein
VVTCGCSLLLVFVNVHNRRCFLSTALEFSFASPPVTLSFPIDIVCSVRKVSTDLIDRLRPVSSAPNTQHQPFKRRTLDIDELNLRRGSQLVELDVPRLSSRFLISQTCKCKRASSVADRIRINSRQKSRPTPRRSSHNFSRS